MARLQFHAYEEESLVGDDENYLPVIISTDNHTYKITEHVYPARVIVMQLDVEQAS